MHFLVQPDGTESELGFHKGEDRRKIGNSTTGKGGMGSVVCLVHFQSPNKPINED